MTELDDRIELREIAAAWAPAIVYMALIFVLSSMNLHPPAISKLPLRDKLVHFFEYGTLGVLCAHAAIRTWPNHARWRTAALGALVTIAFGISDEIHQSFVPGRDAELLDVVADAIGALAGTVIYAAMIRPLLDARQRAVEESTT